VRIHFSRIVGDALKAAGVAVLAHAREGGLDGRHADFHVDYGFGSVKKVTVARSAI
jgi:hypothetical protein